MRSRGRKDDCSRVLTALSSRAGIATESDDPRERGARLGWPLLSTEAVAQRVWLVHASHKCLVRQQRMGRPSLDHLVLGACLPPGALGGGLRDSLHQERKPTLDLSKRDCAEAGFPRRKSGSRTRLRGLSCSMTVRNAAGSLRYEEGSLALTGALRSRCPLPTEVTGAPKPLARPPVPARASRRRAGGPAPGSERATSQAGWSRCDDGEANGCGGRRGRLRVVGDHLELAG